MADYQALIDHLATRNNLKIHNMTTPGPDFSIHYISPEVLDAVSHVEGATFLFRLDYALTGNSDTLNITPTIRGEAINDIKINIPGGLTLAVNSVHAFTFIDVAGTLELELVNLFDYFNLRDVIQDMQDLGLTLVKDIVDPTNNKVTHQYHLELLKDLIMDPAQKITLPDNIYIGQDALVYLADGLGGYLPGTPFMDEGRVKTIAATEVTTQLDKKIILDPRTPAQYEADEGALDNGTIYFQLHQVV